MPASLSPAMIHYMDSRILIVDDNPRFRALAAELLAARGFELVEEVAGGEQALAAVAVECPGGVLLDINLPGLNGFEIAALLAAVCPQTRIVLASADFRTIPAEILKTCPAVAFVSKQQLAVTDLQALFAA